MKLTIFLSIVNCHETKYISWKSYSLSKRLDFTVTSLSVWQNQFCVKLTWASADFSVLCVFEFSDCVLVFFYPVFAYLYFSGAFLFTWRNRSTEACAALAGGGVEWIGGVVGPADSELCTPPSRPPTPSGCCDKHSSFFMLWGVSLSLFFIKKNLIFFWGKRKWKSGNFFDISQTCVHLPVDH